MTSVEQDISPAIAPPPRATVVALAGIGGILGVAVAALLYLTPLEQISGWGFGHQLDVVTLSLLAAGAVFMLAGAILAWRRIGLGGTAALVGALLWLIGCITFKSFNWVLGAPLVLSFLGALTGMISHDRRQSIDDPLLVYRQPGMVRLTHWVWAVTMLFMVLSGLQIFNARPNLYIGQQSGFTEASKNSILDIGAVNQNGRAVGRTIVFGHEFDTTGWLGVSGSVERPAVIAMPGWATIPSFRDLGTGRVVHFFFAWILVGTLFFWLLSALLSGHLWRDIILKLRDLRDLPADIWSHVRLSFVHQRTYTPLQKLSYFIVLVIMFPLIILTGLTMSPGMNAAWPWLLELFGGRQTARTIHFGLMLGFVLFTIIHVLMVVLANPLNELRSMITGYYKIKPEVDNVPRKVVRS